MALRRARIRKSVSITSLIDVIFLLLLFFMLASTFARHSEFEISASAGGATAGAEAEVIQLRITADALFVNGRPATDDTLVARLQEGMARSSMAVAVEVSDDASTQRLTDILLKLNRLPGLQVNVLEPS